MLPFANSPQALLRLHGPKDVIVKPLGRSALTLTWHQDGDTAALSPIPAAQSHAAFLERYGRAYRGLSIPSQPEIAQAYARMGELARGSLIATADGTMLGGFLGSDFDERTVNWTRDSYYAALSCAVTRPEVCRQMIPFLLKWSVPEQCSARGLRRFPQAGPITQSLSNSVSGICLAGAYIRATGDSDWFTTHPEFLDRCQQLLTAVENSRLQKKYMLFPSMFFSDGEARGDFHTGSNVAAWYAFESAATIARVSFQRCDLSERWETIANTIKADLERCCVNRDGEPHFVEGANTDGSLIAGHDGEESETTLMPFYGFCPADDPRLLRHANLALTDANPLYAHEIDGIWWYNEHWSSATFPAWLTHLAGAGGRAEAQRRLRRIAELTDLDGSIWWWPYSYETTDRNQPKRANGAGKCAWAGAIYSLLLLTKILGIRVDALDRSITFAPLLPSERFVWPHLQYGSTSWSFSCVRNLDRLNISLTNHNNQSYAATIVAQPPSGRAICRTSCGPGSVSMSSTQHYGQSALLIEKHLLPGQTLEVNISI